MIIIQQQGTPISWFRQRTRLLSRATRYDSSARRKATRRTSPTAGTATASTSSSFRRCYSAVRSLPTVASPSATSPRTTRAGTSVDRATSSVHHQRLRHISMSHVSSSSAHSISYMYIYIYIYIYTYIIYIHILYIYIL